MLSWLIYLQGLKKLCFGINYLAFSIFTVLKISKIHKIVIKLIEQEFKILLKIIELDQLIAIENPKLQHSF